jgi:hypothetical protein
MANAPSRPQVLSIEFRADEQSPGSVMELPTIVRRYFIDGQEVTADEFQREFDRWHGVKSE